MRTLKNCFARAILPLMVVALSAALVSAQQDTRASLFSQADATTKLASEMKADVLSPKAFKDAMKHYQKADENFKKGRSISDIRKELRAAVAKFQKAIEATKLANVTLSPAITARNGALNAEAPNYAAGLWDDAGKKFAEAAGTLEDGDVNGAKRKGDEARQLFRDAELAAIKVNYLSETWNLLRKAEKLEVRKYAPQSLKVSQDLIAQAEKELNENRYDTDVARGLAKQANYEAKHAIYLTSMLQKVDKRKQSTESLILEAEKPLAKIAATMDLRATFDSGYDESTETIIAQIKILQDQNRKLGQEVADRNEQIASLDERVAELGAKLGGIEKEKSALTQRMEQEARIRQRFASVERLFTEGEAIVLRQGRDVIIRLVGLNFGIAKATIEPEYFALLTKVQKAVRIFPDATLTIEGHTDSYGGDEANVKLSNERAQAVRQYILANMGLAATQVAAVGYGESRPIASNETQEGRTRNRRIDLVIHPNTAGTF